MGNPDGLIDAMSTREEAELSRLNNQDDDCRQALIWVTKHGIVSPAVPGQQVAAMHLASWLSRLDLPSITTHAFPQNTIATRLRIEPNSRLCR